MTGYVDLQVTTNFTFLEGASHPYELVTMAAALGHRAIAITDRNSFAGIVRAHVAAKNLREKGKDIRLIVGVRLDLTDGHSLLAYPTDRAAYGRLCRLISLGRQRGKKGTCSIGREDVREYAEGSVLIVLPPNRPDAAFGKDLRDWASAFPRMVHLALSHLARGDDNLRMATLSDLARDCGVAPVAVNDVLMHTGKRRSLADILTCIRERCTLDDAGLRLQKNAERHLKPHDAMADLFHAYPEVIANTMVIAERCRFNLDELEYVYPDETMSQCRSVQQELVHRTEAGAQSIYFGKIPPEVRNQLDHEYVLIEQLDYAPYFLTVHDIVLFARSKGILCQGRGSAANSTVCYCLGITSVPPEKIGLLFERFISHARKEPPDIDVDFEHERREEVIQHIYEKYGRDRAGLAATVIHYRARRAIREVGKAVGLSDDTVGALASQIWGWSEEGLDDAWVVGLGLDPSAPRLRLALILSTQVIGFPRHLSQHVGGFVITRDRLDESVPVIKAAMENRTVIEWDKDDLDAVGMLKIDVLALGMLTCLRKGFDLLRIHHGPNHTLANIPQDDKPTYDMLGKADSLGVFQVESRAQMSFLPRMKPRNYYDLVVQVAIVRPGPIQGDMVHPYLRRRNKEEDPDIPNEELKEILGKTFGVPLFQEQAMRIAMVAAGFTAEEADQLRRAMASWRKNGNIPIFRDKFVNGMLQKGYPRGFIDRCFSQIEGFGEYGFPESHAASFALLVYVSAWMKCHYPAVFACALLNSQPMGFYAPAQIIRDAREHGVDVRPPDVNFSQWDCTLEDGGTLTSPGRGKILRLGLRQIKGLGFEDVKTIIEARGNHYPDILSLWRRTGLAPSVLDILSQGDAFGSVVDNRRQALWEIKRLHSGQLPLFSQPATEELAEEETVDLPEMSLGEEVVADYQSMCLSLKCHPLSLLRNKLPDVIPGKQLIDVRDGCRVAVAGLVLVRQRPGSAKGVIFLTLEDETGVANVVVWTNVYDKFRRAVMMGRMLWIEGRVQRTDTSVETPVIHVVAEKIEDRSKLLDSLGNGPFALTYIPADGPSHGRSDEVRPGSPPRNHPREQAKILFPSRDFH